MRVRRAECNVRHGGGAADRQKERFLPPLLRRGEARLAKNAKNGQHEWRRGTDRRPRAVEGVRGGARPPRPAVIHRGRGTPATPLPPSPLPPLRHECNNLMGWGPFTWRTGTNTLIRSGSRQSCWRYSSHSFKRALARAPSGLTWLLPSRSTQGVKPADGGLSPSANTTRSLPSLSRIDDVILVCSL